MKQDLAARAGATFRIVTQFGFDADGFVHWAKSTKSSGIRLPIHFGVAAPTGFATLLKFATVSGVTSSVTFLKKHSGTLTSLATELEPENIVTPLE